jgi:Domain of unknown function (DUF4111)
MVLISQQYCQSERGRVCYGPVERSIRKLPIVKKKEILSMEAFVPVLIQPVIDAYLRALEPLRTHFYGIYISGSIALGAFEELASDIDIIALTQGEWSSLELKQLKALHTRLIKASPFGKRLEVSYIPSRYLGVMHPDKQSGAVVPYPVLHDGTFSPASSGSLEAVTGWIIKHNGLRLLGPNRSDLPLEVAWKDVLSTMRFNLDVYFARKAKRPYIYLYGAAVEFAVTNLCRILTTIEEGEIISKSAALTRWRDRLPERWQVLLEEAWRLRHHLSQRSLYRHRFHRMSETLAFIQYGRRRGCKALDASS